MEALNVGESTSLGTGIMISTLLAIDRDLNWLLACEENTHGKWKKHGHLSIRYAKHHQRNALYDTLPYGFAKPSPNNTDSSADAPVLYGL